jgi:hypothetical protein
VARPKTEATVDPRLADFIEVLAAALAAEYVRNLTPPEPQPKPAGVPQ